MLYYGDNFDYVYNSVLDDDPELDLAMQQGVFSFYVLFSFSDDYYCNFLQSYSKVETGVDPDDDGGMVQGSPYRAVGVLLSLLCYFLPNTDRPYQYQCYT